MVREGCCEYASKDCARRDEMRSVCTWFTPLARAAYLGGDVFEMRSRGAAGSTTLRSRHGKIAESGSCGLACVARCSSTSAKCGVCA